MREREPPLPVTIETAGAVFRGWFSRNDCPFFCNNALSCIILLNCKLSVGKMLLVEKWVLETPGANRHPSPQPKGVRCVGFAG